MAGDWIPMRLDLREDPAVIAIASDTGMELEHVVGCCHAVWSWLSRHCHGGTVTNVTLVSLGRALNLGDFPERLANVGWLEESRDDHGHPMVVVPNLTDAPMLSYIGYIANQHKESTHSPRSPKLCPSGPVCDNGGLGGSFQSPLARGGFVALGIDPDSPHVTTLHEAIEQGLGREMPIAQVIGHLALLRDNAPTEPTAKAVGESCMWPCNEFFLVRLLIGTGWLVHRDGVFALGPAWDYVATDWE